MIFRSNTESNKPPLIKGSDQTVASIENAGTLCESRLLSLILTNTAENFLLLDKDLNLVLFNEVTALAVKEMMGVELYKGQNIFDLVQSNRKELLKNIYAEVLGGKQHQTEIEFNIPNKGLRLIHTIFRPAKNEKGEIIGVIILSEDKTEKRKTELEIIESNHNLELLLSNTDEAFIMINRNYEILLFNQKAATIIQSLFGKKLHKGQKFLELATNNRKDLDKEAIEKILSQCFAGHEKQRERILLLEEGFVYLRTVYKPVFNEQKEVIAIVITSKDITREKDAESALKKSEEQWRFALEASNQGLWDWNMVTGDCYFSSSYNKLYGFNENEIENHISEWEKRTHPDDKQLVQNALEEHISNPDPYYECIYRVRAKNGEYKWILSRGMILEKDKEKKPVRMIGTHTDITNQKDAEEGYKFLFYNHPIPMLTYNTDSLKIIEVNNSALKEYGYTREEFLQLSLHDLRPEEDQDDLNAIIETVKEKRNEHKHLGRHKKKSGELFYVEAIGNQFNIKDENVRLVAINNINEQYFAEEKLKDSETQYRLLFKNNPLPSCIYSLDSLNFLEVNDAAVEFYGYSKEEFLLMSVLDIYDDQNKLHVKSVVRNNLQKDKIYKQNWKQKRKNGETVIVNVHGNKITYNGQNGRLIIIDDVTEKLKVDKELAKSNERFLLASQATSDAIYDWDILNDDLSWGGGLQTLFGYDGTNFQIKDWLAQIHKKDKENVSKSLKETLEDFTQDFWKSTYRLKKLDGAYRYIFEKGSIIRSQSGQAIRMVGALQDVTKLKMKERELVKTNERYKYAMLATSEIMWDWNIEEGKILWSDNFQKILGWTLPEDHKLPETFCTSKFHPDDKDRFWNSLQDTINDPAQTHWQQEVRYLKADGNYAHLSDKGYLIRDSNGKALRMIGAMQDMTGEKYHANLVEMERKIFELNASREISFQEVATALLKGIEIIHPQMLTSVLLLNADQTIKTLAAPSLPAKFSASIDGLQIGPTEGSCGTAMFTKKDIIVSDITKDSLWNRWRSYVLEFNLKASWSFPIMDNLGTVMGSFAIYHTTIKEPTENELNTIERARNLLRILMEKQFSQDKIQRANERFDSAMQATHDLIWDWDLTTGSFYRDKKGMKKVYGVEDEKTIENIYVWMLRIHPDDHTNVETIINNILEGRDQDGFELEYRFKRDDGLYNYVFDRGIILRDEDGKPLRIIGAAQDITERKRLEQELLKRELEKQKLIGQATIETQEQERSEIGKELHDNVNQVLTTTKLYLDLSLSNPELKDELIQKSSKNVIYVINEIRQLSRSLMNPSLGDLGLVDSINDLIENINITRKLHVVLEAEEEVEFDLTENQKLTLFRIVQESLNNALKHAKANTVVIHLEQNQKDILLSIKDDGIGFDPVSVKKGAGLKNIQNRVFLANGAISLDSMPGKGCLMQITLPINNNNPI